MSTTFQTSRVETVVKQGWRRRLLVLAVDQSALLLALLFGGLSLLIILGTQILAWQWLLALGAVGAVLGVVGVRRRLADTYRVAQMMDRQLSLNDSLSTAWFLHANQVEDEPAALFQLRRAEELAVNANPAEAFPFERRASWIVAGALGIVALGLFSARYLVTQEISLKRAFLPAALTQVFENLRSGGSDDRNARNTANQQGKTLPPGFLGQNDEHQGRNPKADQGQKPNSQAQSGVPNASGDQAAGQNTEQGKGGEGQEGNQERNPAGGSSPNGSKAEAANQEPNAGDRPDSKQDDATGPQHSSSLMNRMRDALSSVMAKIKPSGTPQDSQSASQKNSEGSKSADQAGNKDQSDDGQKDAGKEQSAQEQSSGEQQGQGTAKAQATQGGKDSAQPSDKKGSDAQSGVGHSDGDKEVKAAEQAKAMGKLAEIIGKRSASLTGDMQIEPSGKQRLQTGYTHQQGQHSDLGGEINRDEVPVEDQEYVREYMELVRKKPGKTAPAK